MDDQLQARKMRVQVAGDILHDVMRLLEGQLRIEPDVELGDVA